MSKKSSRNRKQAPRKSGSPAQRSRSADAPPGAGAPTPGHGVPTVFGTPGVTPPSRLAAPRSAAHGSSGPAAEPGVVVPPPARSGFVPKAADGVTDAGSPRVASQAAGAAATAAPVQAQPSGPVRPPSLVAHMPDGPVQVMSWNCNQLEGVEPHALGLTYWFEAAQTGDPYPVSVRFAGRRVAGDEAPGVKDSFETVRTMTRVVPGSGPIAWTNRVRDVAPGTWDVTATPVVVKAPDGTPGPVPPVPMPQGSSTGTTAFQPVVNVRAPGVRIGAWPALVSTGALVALILQWVLGSQRELPVGRLLVVSLIASLLGLVGAKIYYLSTHRETKVKALTAGMSIQGFVIVAISTLVLGSWVAGIPVGEALDVTAPGLLFGMTIGRLGCFFGGCCVGLPTASRWGIWSSDRGVGVRRIPVQLLESAMAGTVATATLLAVLLLAPSPDGLLFLIGLSAYTFGRQVLFPLRGIPRKTAHGRVATMVVTGLVLLSSVLTLILV